MVRKAQVSWFVERYKMNMGMGYINAHHSLTNFDTGAHLLQTTCDTTAEKMQLGEKIIVKVKDVIHLFLRYAKHMTSNNWVNIQERQTILGLSHLIAGNLTCNYPAKNTCHSVKVLSFNLLEFKSHLACRNIDLDHITNFVPEEGRSEGRCDRYFSLF